MYPEVRWLVSLCSIFKFSTPSCLPLLKICPWINHENYDCTMKTFKHWSLFLAKPWNYPWKSPAHPQEILTWPLKQNGPWVHPCCRAASVLPPWNSRCKIELIFGVMLQFNVVWCIHSRREIVLTIQSDNGKQGYKVGGKKYRRPKVVLSQRPLRTV